MNDSYWEIPNSLNVGDFNFDWLPDINEPPYIHQWGTISDSRCGPRFVDGDATSIKYHITTVTQWSPLDVVFISNGETGEEDRYIRLCNVTNRKVKWVRGVSGRENAIKRAAEISETEWFFCFPGKLSVDEDFNFDFQPNRTYDPKHYIFYAKNPLNDLVYGHQAAVCYNRQLVLDTIDYGLDFTMSKPHDIVPVISGVAEYNSDPLMTWRTAFREVVKLMSDGSEESKGRLSIWTSYARGNNCEWSLIGALDGCNYYKEVSGNHDELMKTFRWEWLSEYFKRIHPK